MPNFQPSAGSASGPIIAEGATLPTIRAAGFEVRVNAYVVGRTRRIAGGSARSLDSGCVERDSSPGCQGGVTDLWYLSLVGARGHGTALRAVWANLVSNHNRAVWLEGVGSVTLGHNRFDLTSLGYPIHWTYRQAVIPPSRDVQGVLEADLLTCSDPSLMPTASHGRSQRTMGKQQGSMRSATNAGDPMHERKSARATGEIAAVTLTSAAHTAERADEAAAREARPLFLLLDPGNTSQDPVSGLPSESWLARLHLRYLTTRIPWLPYYPAWAAYLWQRARERGEAEALHVWCYCDPLADADGRRGGDEGGLAVRETAEASRYLTAAYLCRPDPLKVTADLSRAIATDAFGAASASPSRDRRAA